MVSTLIHFSKKYTPRIIPASAVETVASVFLHYSLQLELNLAVFSSLVNNNDNNKKKSVWDLTAAISHYCGEHCQRATEVETKCNQFRAYTTFYRRNCSSFCVSLHRRYLPWMFFGNLSVFDKVASMEAALLLH